MIVISKINRAAVAVIASARGDTFDCEAGGIKFKVRIDFPGRAKGPV